MRKTITFASLSKYYFYNGLTIDFNTSDKTPFADVALEHSYSTSDKPSMRNWTSTEERFGTGLGYSIEGKIVVNYTSEKYIYNDDEYYNITETVDINLSKIDRLLTAPFTSSSTEWQIIFDGLVSYKPLIDKTIGELIEDGDIINGTRHADQLKMTNRSETVRGDKGDDVIHSRGGDDRLFGNAGKDTLNGGAGDDKLNGGTGADKLTGGRGADTFIFTKISDSKVNPGASDTITDFKRSQGDKIDLQKIDANTKVKGDQVFDFIGANKFDGKAGELRFDKRSGDTIVHGDVNGDGKADFSIVIDASINFRATDFIL